MDVTFSTTFAENLRFTQKRPALALQLELQIGDMMRLTDENNVFWMLKSRYSDQSAQQLFEDVQRQLTQLQTAVTRREPLRIWCSETAEDQLGFMWLCDRLKTTDLVVTQVKVPLDFAVTTPLPAYHQLTGLGELDAQQVLAWQLPENAVTQAERQAVSFGWKSLVLENTALRVSLNGRPVNVPAELLDGWFLPYAQVNLPIDEVIGRLMATLPPGMPDWWMRSRLAIVMSPKLSND